MKKLLLLFCVLVGAVLGPSSSFGWRPDGWVYFGYPHLYASSDGQWFGLSNEHPNEAMWVYSFGSNRWSPIANSGFAQRQGWAWVDWPWAFFYPENCWYYFAPDGSQLAWPHTSGGGWSVFGNPSMQLFPDGEYSVYRPDDFSISTIRVVNGAVTYILGSIEYHDGVNASDTFSFDWSNTTMYGRGFVAQEEMEYGVITRQWHRTIMHGRVTAGGDILGYLSSEYILYDFNTGRARPGSRATNFRASR